jgi:hypothetical protein
MSATTKNQVREDRDLPIAMLTSKNPKIDKVHFRAVTGLISNLVTRNTLDVSV